jgi:formate-dependent nitrite reductase membrane component NrfD
VDLSDLIEEKYKHPSLGAAHLRARDAYRDVPILKRPTWNNEVAAYFFFGGISAGAALIGSLAEVFGGERRQELARTAHYVSFATLLPCPPLLIADLGVPTRFHHMLRIFKPSSPMNLGSWALFTHGAGATVTVMSMLAREGKLPVIGELLRLLPERLLAGLGIPSSFVLAGYTGVLLGTTSIPVWYTSPLLGSLFMSSSLTTGTAATALVSTLIGRESREDHDALASLGLALGAAEVALLGGYIVTSGEAARPLLKGREGAMMAGAAAALAIALMLDAVCVILGRKGKAISLPANLSAIAGGALLRWAIVRAGRASAEDREGTLEAMRPRRDSPGWGA